MQGIFMENGSGGFLSDLAFSGGEFGYGILYISQSFILKFYNYVEPNEISQGLLWKPAVYDASFGF